MEISSFGKTTEVKIKETGCAYTFEPPKCNYEILDDVQKRKVQELISNFKTKWSQGMDDLGQTNVVEHDIELKEKISPIKQAPRSILFHKQSTVQTMIDEMLTNTIIEHSNSPWASPVVLAPKPDGTIRFCIDYRRLNSETKTDAYPLPKIEDLLNQLDGAKYFAKLDLAAGYCKLE